MIIVLKSGATEADVADVERRIRTMGYTPHTIHGELRNVIGAIGDDRGKERLRALESLECVESVTPILQPFKLASREVKRQATQVMVGDVAVGGRDIVVMAGPCSVESRFQVMDVAVRVKAAGARVLRGGAFKPRTSPYAFQGLEDRGAEAAGRGPRETGTPSHHRGDGAGQGRAGGRALRHSSDRRAQRAELLAAAARGRDPQAGAAQAGHVHQHPGVAAVRRVRAGRRQSRT